MSRHRDVRNRKYSDDFDVEDVFGHSVEEDSCMSPSDSAQWMFDRSRNQQAMSHFLSQHDNITEEGEDDGMTAIYPSERRESLDIRNLNLDEAGEAKLMSCLDELRNILGDSKSDSVLIQSVMKHNFDFSKALDELLNSDKLNILPPQFDGTKPLLVTEILPKTKTVEPVPKLISATIDVNSPSVVGFNVKPKVSLIASSSSPRDLSPAPGQSAQRSESEIKIKIKESKVDPQVQYNKERGSDKDHLYIVVIGHVDAGKSTLMGRFLCDLGEISKKTLHKYEQESKKIGKQSFMYAWVLDETGEERSRGITMDVGRAHFATTKKVVTILDAPGHADFIPNMITGAAQADVALLVVDATRGEFESGFDLGGQTREHALLVRSLGVSQLAVAVNKLDTCNWSQDRFNEIVKKLKLFLKQAGFKDSDVSFIPCSGLTGENLINEPNESELLKWYKEPSLFTVIDNFNVPERPVSKPLRMTVNDIFKGTGSGHCVAGRVETGVLNKGDKVLVCPTKEVSDIKNITINEMPVNVAFAGDQVSVTLSGVDIQNMSIGFIISDPINQVPVTMRFEARIVVFNVKNPITKGYPVLLHHQSLIESASIVKLKSLLNKSTGEVVKKKPRCLGNNSVAVVEVEVCRPICIEVYKNVKELGRFMLRVAGKTIAAGLVTDIKSV